MLPPCYGADNSDQGCIKMFNVELYSLSGSYIFPFPQFFVVVGGKVDQYVSRRRRVCNCNCNLSDMKRVSHIEVHHLSLPSVSVVSVFPV